MGPPPVAEDTPPLSRAVWACGGAFFLSAFNFTIMVSLLALTTNIQFGYGPTEVVSS